MLICMTLAALPARAEPTRPTNPNVLGVEGLGKAGLWSVFFDRALNEDLVGGAGFGTLSLGVNTSMTLIPMYVNYYFSRESGSFFGTAGVDIALLSNATAGATSSLGGFGLDQSGVVPQVGVGYESRGDSGFLFRVAGYVLFFNKISPWVGFSLGWAF
jgi:hypothetical protein